MDFEKFKKKISLDYMDLENFKKTKCQPSFVYKAKNHDCATLAFAYTLIIITQIFSLIFVDIFLWFQVSPFCLIIEVILSFLMLYNLVICHCIDPGVLKRGNLELTETEQKKLEDEMFKKIRFYMDRYCQTCKIMRPPKSSHCRECDHCVKGFDHHCFFVGNCIAARNRGNFLWFLTFSSLQTIYRISISLLTIILILETKDGLNQAYRNQIDIFIGTFVFLGLAILFFLFCTRQTGIFICLLLIALIFVIAGSGSAKAIEQLPELTYYEYPIFGLINIVSMIPFVFWLVPTTIANYYNVAINITSKEREALNDAVVFNPEALKDKKMIKKTEKIKNIFDILFASRIKSEIL